MAILTRRTLLSGAATAAGAMAAAPAAKAEAPAKLPAVMADPDDLAPRERLLMDFGWRFALGHAHDTARDFGFGLDQRTYAKAGTKVAAAAELDFDDKAWTPVQLPHDWAIDLPFVPTPNFDPKLEDDPRAAHGYKPLGREYPETSVGWYRKRFDLPAADAGKRLSLEFDGVFRDCLVLFNGYVVHHHQGGYSPFRVDITDFAMPGEANQLTLRVDASLGEGWFYEGAGVYRHVWLVKTDPLHVKHWGVFVRSEVRGSTARLLVSAELVHEGDGERKGEVVTTILGPDGRPVVAARSGYRLKAWGEHTLDQMLTVEAPALWSIETPSLYRALTEVRVGDTVVDRQVTTFGIRTIRFDAEHGFFLNDRPVKLLGTCNHHDHAGLGAALPDRMQAFRIEKLKAMGSNAYRSAHNPAAPELLDACDRLGMVVIDETRRMSSDPAAMAELEALVRRSRNHPSIILWSIGNEEQAQQGTERGARIARTMRRLVDRLDGTRLTTAALDSGWGDGVSKVVDVLGFNYRVPQMEPYHGKVPGQPILASEAGSTVSTRGAYVHDDKAHVSVAYDREHPWWASTAEAWWTIAAERPYIAGGFIWTGFDYRGEPTPFSRWPSVASYFGVMDSCGFPKDNYFYYRAWWDPAPLLHLFPHWTWPGREGQDIEVWCHSNLDRVELILNGRSLGSKDVVRNRHLQWTVPYAPGVLEARGWKDGKLVLTERRETAGPPAALRLSADRTRIAADGEDVSVITVEVVDAKGRPVPDADHLVRFEVAGPGRVIGVGNGDPTSHEPDRASRRRLFHGLAMAVVQADGKAGKLTVKAAADGVASASLKLEVLPATARPRA